MRVYPEMEAQEEEQLKHVARENSKEDLHYLAKEVLGYHRITDHIHKDMSKDIDTPKYRFKLLLWPRGHFKSTIGTESYSIQRLLNDPNERVLITNVKLSNSRKFLRTIANHFTNNAKFRWVWRDWWINNYATEFDRSYLGDKLDWITRDVQDELFLLRPSAGREASVSAGAMDASMVSQHYSTIIADDLVNRDYVRTLEMVEKSILYFRDMLDLLDADGTLMVIGTRWSHMDLYQWIIEEFGHKASIRVPEHLATEEGELKKAVERSDKTPEESKNWMISVRPTSVKNPIFPEEYNSEVLQGLIEAKGPYEYGAQYELNPTPAEHQKFKDDWLRTIDVLPESKLADLDICLTVDPAISLEDTACNSAIAVCGYDEQNQMYLLDGRDERLGEDQLPEALWDLVVKWADLGRFLLPVGFEALGFQELYVYTMERMMLERDFFFGIEPITRRQMSKDERILRLVPRIKNGFFMPRSLMVTPYGGGPEYDLIQKVKWGLLKFPFAGNKDFPDAMADQLDIVKAHRPPREYEPPKEEAEREFTHPSVMEDKRRRKRQKAEMYNDAVR